MGYCILKEDMNYAHLSGPFPSIPERTSFLNGEWVDVAQEEPFICNVDCDADEEPCHFLDDVVPIFSGALLEQLQLAGIDNFQKFPVILRNPERGLEWPGYFAVNVLGLIDSVDMGRSAYDELMPGDDEVPELLDFDEMVIDSSKTNGALMFRDLRSPEIIIFDDRIIEYLKASVPPEGWRLRIKLLPT